MNLASSKLLLGAGVLSAAALAGEAVYQLDPFGQATHGDAQCPVVKPTLLTADQMHAESHVRVERGTRCAMEGSCEPGGAYRRDPEINAAVIAAIGSNARFSDTSIWVTTSRGWVTLEGCVRSNAERKAVVAFVARQPDVSRVFDQLRGLAK